MAKRNNAYWQKRMEALEDEQHRCAEAYYRDMQEQFHKASDSIQRDIERWYQRLADNNGISYASAKRLLKDDELKEFKWTVEQYVKAGKENALDQRWMKELENASAKFHINRLQAMRLQIQQHAELLFKEYEGGMTDFLHQSYGEQFYRTAYEISRGTGVGFNLARIDERKIDALIKHPWAQDGASFSDRIWANKEKLVRNLHTELSQCIIRGESPQKAVSRLAKTMGVSQSQAANLILTESAAISSIAQKDCFRELEVDRYQFDATLDGRTCETCGALDQKAFKMSEFEIGITAPPIHPRCRCCIVPYFDDWDEFGIDAERAARDPETGKTIYVDGNLSYNNWKEQAFGTILKETTDKWSREAKEELLADEEVLSRRKKETAVVYGPDGEYLFQKRGNENEIQFTWAQSKRLIGSVISHNHPLGTSLSGQDICTLLVSKAVEVRAATESGVYYMRAPQRWPAEINTADKILSVRKEIDEEVKKECQTLYKAGKLTRAERHLLRVDETNRRFAERYGLDYGKEEYKETQ